MMKHKLYFLHFILFTLFSLGECVFFPYVYPRIKLEASPDGDVGVPLFITKYLKKGLAQKARDLSRVSLTDKIGFRSHSGFFTVDERYSSNLFFWYFPPFSNKEGAPVILWLQGGPGGSSLFGLFTEIGPLIAKKEGFAKRKYHWSLNYHVIFIDNPVGTGFSFTRNHDGYCNDEGCVGRNLYSAMSQFFTLFPDLINNDFYICGESYAGKYIPSLGMEIHRQNKDKEKSIKITLKGMEEKLIKINFKGMEEKSIKIKLKGMAIGNGYCDPVHQLDYGPYLYQHGLIDNNQLALFNQIETEIKDAIQQKDWINADILMDHMLDGELSNSSYFKNFTGFQYYYNFLQTEDNLDTSVFTDLLNNNNVRNSIHVGRLSFNSGVEVQFHLAEDILKSVAPDIAELLSHYRILFYNGQLDIIVAYPLTENFLRNLKFGSAREYKSAKRKVWRVGREIAGYYKTAGNLTEVLVRNAGHMVPSDQPKWALDMITRFIRNKI